MALTITATVGSASANSFGTLDEFAAHMETRLKATAFNEADLESKKRALLEACLELNVLQWKGQPTDDTQALNWPREYAPNPDAAPQADTTDTYYDDDVVPGRMKRAQFELAYHILAAGSSDLALLDPALNIARRVIAGAVDTQYVDTKDRAQRLAKYPQVMREIRPLLSASTLSNRVVRT